MIRNRKVPALLTLCCVVAGAGLVGCDDSPGADSDSSAATSSDDATDTEGTDDAEKDAENSDEADDGDQAAEADSGDDENVLTGSEKIDVDGRSVNVSCSGSPADGAPVIVLMHGGGHSLEEMADLQESLSEENRVCSYDRLGAGASDEPEGPQTIDDSGDVLTAVLDTAAGDTPVVLAGHSLGGLVAARYAPDHQDRVTGLVLMDATSPTQNADLTEEVPESASGPAAELRDESLAVFAGENPEQLVIEDGEVRSAGDIPVEVIQHGQQYLAEVPEYGPGLELAWTRGQINWLAVSDDSRLLTAGESGHDIHVDEPETAVEAIERVVAQATDQA